MTIIAVIGSNSFSGSNFIDAVLKKTDYKIIGISRSSEKNRIFLPHKKNENGRFVFHQLDINKDLEKIINLLKKENVDIVVNYAAQGTVEESWNNPEQWFKTNCMAVVNLVQELRKLYSLKKYIHISTNEVYGSCTNADENAPLNPSTPYASSKAAADIFIKNFISQFNFPAILIRSTNVYGPGQDLFRIIPRSIINLKLNKGVQLHGGGKAKKSYLYIEDNSEGTLKIVQFGKIGQIYNLSSSKSISIKDVVRKICEKLGKNFDNCVETVEERQGQDSEYLLDSTKARKDLNWEPKTEFDEGIDKCIEWVNKNWDFIRTSSLEYQYKS